MGRHLAGLMRLIAAALMLGAMLAAPAPARAAGGCSPYMGQVVINELRIGKSNNADQKNQIELYNAGAVAAEVWKSWRIVVYGGDSLAKAVRKGSYAMSTGFVANGAFIYNSNVKLWARNGDNNNKPRASDFAVLDANGDFVAYVAIGAGAQATPACLGTRTVLTASPGGDANGDAMRQPDGGAWPASVTKTSVHTIGRTNACSAGADPIVSIDVSYTRPTRSTTVTYTVTVFNNACSGTVSGAEISVSSLTGTNFNATTVTQSAGSVASSGGNLVWTVGNINAGVTRTLVFTGMPRNLGVLTSTATLTKPTSGLINTGDDSDSTQIDVQPYNWVGFDIASDTATEGSDPAYSATISMSVPSNGNRAVTVSYSVSGTANASDTNLPASGSVTIPAGETSASIDFSILDDSLWEPTKSIVLTITGVTSNDAEVRAEGTASTLTVELLDNDPLAVHHYELSAPTQGVACLASTVTVVACADASSPCTNRSSAVAGQTASLSASQGTLGNGNLVFDANGQAATTHNHPGATDGSVVTLTLGGESVPAASTPLCCPPGSACAAGNSCNTTFYTAGFVIASAAGGAATSLPTQTAGTSSGNHVLRAVRTSTTTQACEAALTGTTAVNWSYTCQNPASCAAGNRLTLSGAAPTAIAGNPSGSTAASTPVSMVFDANGNAPFSFAYADVGQITLRASKAAGGALLAPLVGVSNAFVVRPAGFTLTSIRCANYASGSCATAALASPGHNPGATSANGPAFMPAGQPFAVTVTAVDAAGNATPNFGRESPAEGVSLVATLLQPVGGQAPALRNAGAFGAFNAGSATGSAFAWDEVGIIALTPGVADGSYLGTGSVTGATSGSVGRFVPHHLDVAVTPACGAFSYAGQPFAVSVTARGALAGTTTRNYQGSFARGVQLADTPALVAGSLAGAAVAATAFSSGQASASVSYVFTDKPTAPQTLVLRAVDADATSSAGWAEGSTALRSGRLRIANGYGSEKSALQLSVLAEHWSGQAWVTNSADSCTSLPAAAVVQSNRRDARGAATGAWTSSASAITITAGAGSLTLGAPSPAGSGSVDLALNLGASGTDQSCLAAHPASTGANLGWMRSRNGACAATWDRDPSARASFGIFSPETRRTVHTRELF